MSNEIKSSLHLHPDIAQLVGLVVADYAMLENLMYVIYAAITNEPDAAFVRFYELRHSHLREELMRNAAGGLDEPLQKALQRLWRRFKAAARRRTEIAHVTFLSNGTTLARMRLYGTEPRFEPLSPTIFDRTFSQYHALGLDLLCFAALLAENVEAIHELTARLPSAQFQQMRRELPPPPNPLATFGERDTVAMLVRLKLWDWFQGRAFQRFHREGR